MKFSLAIYSIVALAMQAAPAIAQSVVMNLPPDGTWVRYEGTYTQAEIRPNTALGKLEIPPWIEHVTIKSVGTAMAEYRGETVPCRWLEIKVERGSEADGKIVVGKTGLEIYKVLVPEPAVSDNPIVEEGIPVGYLPLVRGVRLIGQGQPEPLAEPALKLYPLALLFSYCRDTKTEESNVDPATGLGPVACDVLAGSTSLERPDSRTEMTVKMWVSPEVPFGVAAWNAKIVRSIKDAQEPREAFTPTTQVDVDLKAQGKGLDAQSEIDFE